MRRLLPLLVYLGCAGPRPQVDEVRLLATQQGGRQHVEVRLHNRGGGEGLVELEVRLQDRRGGAPYLASERVDLRGHDDVRVVVAVLAPQGEYSAEATVHYPPN